VNGLTYSYLGEIAKLNPSFGGKSLRCDELVDFLPMSAVNATLTTARATEQRTFQSVQKGYTNFADGDVLLAKITPCFENGKIAVAQLNTSYGFGSTEFHVVRADKTRLDGRYLVHFLRRNEIRVDGARNMTGSGGQRRVPRHYLESLSVPLPPLPEQRRVADILDQANALRAKRREALAQLDILAKSVFIEMFGDPLVNPKHWKLGTIKDALLNGWLLGLQDGNHGESHPKVSDFSKKGIPFVMANCLVDGELDIEKAYKLDESWLRKLRIGFAQPNDLLISHKGTVGELAIVPENCPNAILSPQTTYYRPSHKLNVRFLMGFFGTQWFQTILEKEAIQSTRAYIGITRQKALPMMFPPLELQNQYAAQIEIISGIRRKHLEAMRVLDSLCASLQHRAFRGEL
jgi:type I restriction enzyme S subunit